METIGFFEEFDCLRCTASEGIHIVKIDTDLFIRCFYCGHSVEVKQTRYLRLKEV